MSEVGKYGEDQGEEIYGISNSDRRMTNCEGKAGVKGEQDRPGMLSKELADKDSEVQ